MAIPSGLSAQFGIKIPESAYGTYTAPDRFFPLVNESMKKQIDPLESNAIIAGARILRSQQWSQGNITCTGDVGLELYDRSVGQLLRACFGAVATAGAGPYTHTFTPGDLMDDYFTMQVGRPDVGGTVRPFSYTGCQVTSWEIACAAGEIATMGLSVIAQNETTAQALASVSYAASIRPMTFMGGALTVGGSSANVRKLTIKGDNKLAGDRHFFASQLASQPIEQARRDYGGTFEVEFESLTNYNLFINGTESAVVATFAAGAQTLVFTMNVRFDGETPNVTGMETLKFTMPWKCVGASTDAGAVTAVFTTTESTP